MMQAGPGRQQFSIGILPVGGVAALRIDSDSEARRIVLVLALEF